MNKLISCLAGLYVLFGFGCGPNYHLKQAVKKGAEWKSDTVTIEKDIIIAEIKRDTVFAAQVYDTVVIEKDRLKIKYVRLAQDSFLIEGECEGDTIKVTETVTVTNTIECDDWPWWYLLIAALVGAGLIALIKK